MGKNGTIPPLHSNGIFITKERIMKKIIKLTESDLNRIIKRVINESSMSSYKLPEGITMELINRFLNENDPNVLNRIYDEDHNVIKRLIRSFYVDQKPLKEIVDEFHIEAENGTLFNERWKNERWSYHTEKYLLKMRKWVLEGLLRWSKVPTVEDSEKILKRYETSQLKQSLYKLLSSYSSKLTPDEINDILIDVRLNKNVGPEKFDVDLEWVKRKYRDNNG